MVQRKCKDNVWETIRKTVLSNNLELNGIVSDGDGRNGALVRVGLIHLFLPSLMPFVHRCLAMVIDFRIFRATVIGCCGREVPTFDDAKEDEEGIAPCE